MSLLWLLALVLLYAGPVQAIEEVKLTQVRAGAIAMDGSRQIGLYTPWRFDAVERLIIDRLAAELADDDTLIVRTERGLWTTGEDEEPASIGQVGDELGAEILIVVTGKIWVEDREQEDQDKSDKEPSADREPLVRRTGDLEIRFEMWDVATESLLGQTWRLARKSWVDSLAKLPVADELERQLVKEAAPFDLRLKPYSVKEKIAWDGHCEGKICDQALKALRRRDHARVKELLSEQLERAMANKENRQQRQGKDRNLAAVYYNFALNEEAQGEYKIALGLYNKALDLRRRDPSKKLQRAIARVEEHLRAWEAYRAAERSLQERRAQGN